MASTSMMMGKGKELEKKNGEEEKDKNIEGRKRKYKDMHVKLDCESIKVLKNPNSWREKAPNWTVTEEQVEDMSMRIYDFDYVLNNHFLDEQIVWESDVWGLQDITAIPSSREKEAHNNSSDKL